MVDTPLIGVCGPIGVGKTTVVLALARELGFAAWPERVEDNSFFARYLADPDRWAFHSQLAFIMGALEDARSAHGQPPGGVLERPAEEMLEVFGRYLRKRGSLEDEELSMLTRLVAFGGPDAAPDLLILLRGEPRALLDRIGNRGRPGEDTYTLEDLEQLDTAYERWRSTLDPNRFVELDAVACDLRSDAEKAWLATEVRAHLKRNW